MPDLIDPAKRDPTDRRIDRDIQDYVETLQPPTPAQRVAAENTLQNQRNLGVPIAVPQCSSPERDPVDHPPHYTAHPSGVECITVAEHMGFNLGNAVKYIWRADLKGDAVEDLRKAAWYLQREIERRTR